VKLVALAAAILSIVLAGALVSTQETRAGTSPHVTFRLLMPGLQGSGVHRVALPLAAPQDNGGTPTATATGTPQPPSPTPTTSPYPDPVALLTNAINLYTSIKNIHFSDIYVGTQTGSQPLQVNATGTGVANCTPSDYVKVKGVASIPGTAQRATVKYEMVQRKNTYWKKNLTGKGKHVWKKVTESKTEAFGFSFDNPLACGATSSGGSGGTDTLKDIVNLGPTTYHGQKVWHIQATDVSTDTSGTTTTALLDYWVTQGATTLPVGYKVTIDDATQGISVSLEQVLSQLGKKVKIPSTSNR